MISLFAGDERKAKRERLGDPLQVLDRHIDFAALARAVDARLVIGGGARSRHWGGIIAAALGVTLDYLDGGEVGPALGAARLARIAVTGESPEAVCPRPPVLASIAPDPALAARLAPKLEKFRAAYPALKNL